MKSGKQYVVFNGRKPGVYNTWINCYAQINGFKESVVRLYDSVEEGELAWLSFSQSPSSSLIRKCHIDKAVEKYYGYTNEVINTIADSHAVDDYIQDDFDANTVVHQNMQKILRDTCNAMRMEQPLYTLQDTKFIGGVKHYRYRASLANKIIGKPPVSLGRYANTIKAATEDVAVLLLRRILSSSGKKIVDYNNYNVELLEAQLDRAIDTNNDLRIENATLIQEKEALSNKIKKP